MGHSHAYPHEGGCQGCADARVCNVCGGKLSAATKCTNGRCGTCHAKHCTSGGSTSPGHGFGTVGTRSRSRRSGPPEGERDQLDYPWNEPGAPFRSGDY